MEKTVQEPSVIHREPRPTWYCLLALLWLMIWMAQLTPTQLLLPQQIQTSVDPLRWTDGVMTFGLIFSAVGLVALLVAPTVGRVSDRLRGRRRRPLMLAGTFVAATGLMALGFQSNALAVLVCWLIVSVGLVTLSTVLSAAIADQVAPQKRGVATGVVGGTQALGLVLGVMICVLLGLSVQGGYAFLAVSLAVVGGLSALIFPDPVYEAKAEENHRGSWAKDFVALSETLRQHKNFRLAIATTVFVNVGNALVTALLLYFLAYGLGAGLEKANEQLLFVILIYSFFVVLAAFFSGTISDRLKSRIPIILGTIFFQIAGVIIMIISPTLTSVCIVAGMLGLSYGGFTSVNLALIIDILPHQRTIARDMSLVQIAQNVPQTISPVFGALAIAATSGFVVLFVMSAFFSLLGLIWVIRLSRINHGQNFS